MTTNPRDILEESTDRYLKALGVDLSGAELDPYQVQIDDLKAAGFVVVACPSGGRVVVSRESKPCDECAGTGNRFYEVAEGFCDCIGCGGSGVVEATTTYGLEAVAGAWWNETYARRGDLVIDDDRQDGDMPLYRLVAAVALPEDGA